MERVVTDKIHITIQVDPDACTATVIVSGIVEQFACPDITRVLWRLKAISGARPVVVDFTAIDDPDHTAVETLQHVCTSLNFRTRPPAHAEGVSAITQRQKTVILGHGERTPA